MREAPLDFGKSKNLINKEGYHTNQNLGNNQLNSPHKKSILEDSYINHDILSSHSHLFVNSQLRQRTISSTLNFRQHTISLAYYSSQLLLSSTSISESQEIIWQLYNLYYQLSFTYTVRGPIIIKQ